MYTLLVEDEYGLDRDTLMARLRQRGIDTRPAFYPVHTLPMYHQDQCFPVAEELGRKGLNLPSGATLTPEQVHLVCDVLAEMSQPGG